MVSGARSFYTYNIGSIGQWATKFSPSNFEKALTTGKVEP